MIISFLFFCFFVLHRMCMFISLFCFLSQWIVNVVDMTKKMNMQNACFVALKLNDTDCFLAFTINIEFCFIAPTSFSTIFHLLWYRAGTEIQRLSRWYGTVLLHHTYLCHHTLGGRFELTRAFVTHDIPPHNET